MKKENGSGKKKSKRKKEDKERQMNKPRLTLLMKS